MQALTITEALAEIKTLEKRIEKNMEYTLGYLVRDDRIRDPFENDGGSAGQVTQYRQSSADLRTRWVRLRSAIQKRNQTQVLEIEGVTRTLADWIVWRREVSAKEKQDLDRIALTIEGARKRQREQNAARPPEQAMQLIVNLDERALAEARDRMEKILGQLDGQLSLRNATTLIEVE